MFCLLLGLSTILPGLIEEERRKRRQCAYGDTDADNKTWIEKELNYKMFWNIIKSENKQLLNASYLPAIAYLDAFSYLFIITIPWGSYYYYLFDKRGRQSTREYLKYFIW